VLLLPAIDPSSVQVEHILKIVRAGGGGFVLKEIADVSSD
jgi:hypothetical protein